MNSTPINHRKKVSRAVKSRYNAYQHHIKFALEEIYLEYSLVTYGIVMAYITQSVKKNHSTNYSRPSKIEKHRSIRVQGVPEDTGKYSRQPSMGAS